MIILYNPQSSPNKKPILPMSLLALGAVLEGRYDYRIIDGNLVDDGADAIIAAVREFGADILAITVMPGPQLAEAVALTKKVRAACPDLTIAWGGYFPTLHPLPCIRAPEVDYVFQGHCELQFPEFIDRVRAGDAEFDLPGLVRRDRSSGEIKKNPKPPVPDLNELPDWPYHQIEMRHYLRPTFLGSRTISHHSSYGCPFTCNFCAVVNMVKGRYSAQSAEKTAEVVTRLVEEFDANAIEFHDNNFFVQESRVAEFCDRINHLGINWWAFGRIDTMMKFDDSTWEKMRDSGLKMVFMGAEAGSDETLKRMNKGGKQTADQALAIAERMRRYDIIPEMSFIFGNPPDAEKDVENTFRFIRRLKKVNPATEIIFYIYTPVPLVGDLYTAAMESGFDYPESVEEWADSRWVEFVQHRTSDLPWLEKSLKRRIKNFQTVLHAAYPTVTDRNLTALKRNFLKVLGGWRFWLGVYARPLELKLLHRIMPYQRPETSGF